MDPAKEQPPSTDYQELFREVQGRPCQVTYIDKVYESGRDGRGDGAEPRKMRTKPSIIERELQCIYDASNLGEIHQALVKATSALQELDVFNSIDLVVTEAPEVWGYAATIVFSCFSFDPLHPCMTG